MQVCAPRRKLTTPLSLKARASAITASGSRKTGRPFSGSTQKEHPPVR